MIGLCAAGSFSRWKTVKEESLNRQTGLLTWKSLGARAWMFHWISHHAQAVASSKPPPSQWAVSQRLVADGLSSKVFRANRFSQDLDTRRLRAAPSAFKIRARAIRALAMEFFGTGCLSDWSFQDRYCGVGDPAGGVVRKCPPCTGIHR